MKRVLLLVLNNFKNDSRVLKEAISLKKNGYDVKVVALWEDGLKEFDKINGVTVHRIKLKTKNWSKNKLIQSIKYFELFIKIISNYKNYDIFHCNDLNTLPIGVIIKNFFNKKAKIVYDAHEFETETNGLSNIQKKLLKILEKNLIKYVDKTITVSQSIANEYKKLYPFIGKPALILNTPPYKKINKKNLFREELGIGQEQTIFLYQGGLSSGRGIEILLDTFKEIENKNLVIVFMGYGPLEKEIKEASKKYNNIFFHPAVNPEILLDYTSSADFGISFVEDSCLSYRYCLPNKLFEYLIVEIPVIVSNLYEMKKFVEKYKIGVVAKENSRRGLSEAINKAIVLNKKELSKNIKKVKKIYNWENQEKKLIKIYNDL